MQVHAEITLKLIRDDTNMSTSHVPNEIDLSTAILESSIENQIKIPILKSIKPD